jgi:hypothetical protein
MGLKVYEIRISRGLKLLGDIVEVEPLKRKFVNNLRSG